MPRKSVKTAIEGKTVKRQTTTRLKEARLPGEIQHKKNLAVILKIGTFTNTQIAQALGERKSTVREWFKDPAVIELYQDGLASISTAAKQLLETLTIEAVKVLGEFLASDIPGDKRWAVEQILDRGGLPKSRREESKREEAKDIRLTDSEGNDLATQLQNASPETLAQAERNLSEIEELLKKNA